MFFGWPINIVWVYVLYLYECKNFFGCFRLGEKTRWIVPGCATANRSSLDSFLETRDNLRRLKLESTDFAVRGRCDSGGTDLSKSHEHTGNVFYFRNTIDYTLNYKQRDFKYIVRSLDLVFFSFLYLDLTLRNIFHRRWIVCVRLLGHRGSSRGGRDVRLRGPHLDDTLKHRSMRFLSRF